MPNGLALCALHHRLFDHGAITVHEDLRVRVARALAGSSARGLLEKLDGQEIRLPIEPQLYPNPGHLHWHHAEVFKGRMSWWSVSAGWLRSGVPESAARGLRGRRSEPGEHTGLPAASKRPGEAVAGGAEGRAHPQVCRLLAAHRLGPDNGTTLEGVCVPRGGDDARHTQGFTNLPRHIPRLALRASSSAST